MRGEYSHIFRYNCPGQGSPPLARGILQLPEGVDKKLGITPACAGNTRQYSPTHRTRQDHPRLRGEYKLKNISRCILVGSPPLARGILDVIKRSACACGITPACAGNTLNYSRLQKRSRDHPRLRGEYSIITLLHTILVGSPPLARGIPHLDSRSVKSSEDHPRLRGEYRSTP